MLANSAPSTISGKYYPEVLLRQGKTMTRIAIFPLLLLVGACQLASVNQNVDSPFYPPPVGSKLILKTDITIPPDNAGVMLQGGQVMNQRSINQYQPNCRFEVNAVLSTAQTVAADEFQVTHVTTNSYQVRSRDGFTKVSNLSWFNYVTIMKLSSPRQPNVRSLTCQQWGDPAMGKQVSISQMRTALGDFFSLELPPGSPGEKPQK
jgi:hypothetical protein